MKYSSGVLVLFLLRTVSTAAITRLPKSDDIDYRDAGKIDQGSSDRDPLETRSTGPASVPRSDEIDDRSYDRDAGIYRSYWKSDYNKYGNTFDYVNDYNENTKFFDRYINPLYSSTKSAIRRLGAITRFTKSDDVYYRDAGKIDQGSSDRDPLETRSTGPASVPGSDEIDDSSYDMDPGIYRSYWKSDYNKFGNTFDYVNDYNENATFFDRYINPFYTSTKNAIRRVILLYANLAYMLGSLLSK